MQTAQYFFLLSISLKYILNSTCFFIRLLYLPFFPYFSIQFWLLQEKLCFYPPLNTSKPLPEGSIIGRSKRFTFSPISSSTGIANPLNSKSKQDAKFHFLILTHEDPDCSFCPINLGYALAADTESCILGHQNEHQQEQTVPSILPPRSHRCKLFSALPLGESCPVAKCYKKYNHCD